MPACGPSFTRHTIDPAGIMPECPKCAGHLVRIHRGYFRKIVYSALFRCRRCGLRTGEFHSGLSSNFQFVFSRNTRCVRCGTYDVRRGSRRDRIDGVSGHPLSLLQHILAAPLNKCPACRLQYYDWRRQAAQRRLIREVVCGPQVPRLLAQGTPCTWVICLGHRFRLPFRGPCSRLAFYDAPQQVAQEL